MNTDIPEKNFPTRIQEFFAEPVTLYTLIVSISISTLLILEAAYPPIAKWLASLGLPWLEQYFPFFVATGDLEFGTRFIEWFGIVYGFSTPIFMVRALEQLYKVDHVFDHEAGAIQVLLEDILLLDDRYLMSKKSIVEDLKNYVEHVLDNYQIEHLEQERSKQQGDYLLMGIRRSFRELIYSGGAKAERLELVTTELLERLNEAINIRRDRILICGERSFQAMKVVAVLTSIVWLIPFYFLPWELSGLGGLLKMVVTFLVIFILTIIDDLDDPFAGIWQVSTATWREVRVETESALIELETKANDHKGRKKKAEEQATTSPESSPKKRPRKTKST